MNIYAYAIRGTKHTSARLLYRVVRAGQTKNSPASSRKGKNEGKHKATAQKRWKHPQFKAF